MHPFNWPQSVGKPGDQSGVALLQVLLISAVISVLAIRFSHTAQDHVQIAEDFDARIRAQLLASSVFHEVLVSELSDEMVRVDANYDVFAGGRQPGYNRHGDAFLWRDSVRVSIQDYNGLLPMLYPRYFLWRELLENLNIDTDDINRHLGVWEDIQDADGISWQGGDSEPATLQGGQAYPNQLAQNNLFLKWAFADNPDLGRRLSSYSSLYPYAEINPLHMPSALLDDLFTQDLAGNIKRVREDFSLSVAQRASIFPDRYTDGQLHFSDSLAIKISVMVPLDLGFWRQSWHVRLAPAGNDPFFILPD